MFYKLIQNKRNEWLQSAECTVNDLLNYIDSKGMMRDAQLEAIKTYLFLKIACDNKPLWQLFSEGEFNSLDLAQLELSETSRKILSTNKAAAALLEYSRLTDKNGNQLAPKLETIFYSIHFQIQIYNFHLHCNCLHIYFFLLYIF